VDRLRAQTLDRVQEVAAPAPKAVEAAGAWDRPLPVLALTPEPAAPAARPAPASGTQAASVAPFYLIIDESPADDAYFEALDGALQELPAALAESPQVLAAVRLAVLGYAGDVVAHMSVNAITADTMLPQLTPRPGASLSSVFTYLHRHIPRDMERLKSRHAAVVRPTAYLLCATTPDGGLEWQAGLERILDRTAFPAGPNIVVCGAGAMPDGMLEAITAQPGCHAFASDPGIPLHEAAGHYVTFAQREIAAQVRAQFDGSADVALTPPSQFHALRGFRNS
jgi:uncharacterized protein YegL